MSETRNEIHQQIVECESIQTGGARDVEVLKSKDSLKAISTLVQRPILKCGKQYAIVDGQTAYLYEDK
jgi:hypothetical protein